MLIRSTLPGNIKTVLTLVCLRFQTEWMTNTVKCALSVTCRVCFAHGIIGLLFPSVSPFSTPPPPPALHPPLPPSPPPPAPIGLFVSTPRPSSTSLIFASSFVLVSFRLFTETNKQKNRTEGSVEGDVRDEQKRLGSPGAGGGVRRDGRPCLPFPREFLIQR